MPDFDKRKIPTLDDVIEIADNEKINFDLKIGRASCRERVLRLV